MATSRLSSFVSASALVATFACAPVALADGNASRSTAATPAHHATTLPPIVPLEAMLGMSLVAGVVGIALSRRRA
jgi:hypothetical protein